MLISCQDYLEEEIPVLLPSVPTQGVLKSLPGGIGLVCRTLEFTVELAAAF